MKSLTAISPLDGRYYSKVSELSDYFSESALMKYRTKVEIEYFIALSKKKVTKKLSTQQITQLRNIYEKFSLNDADEVKKIEKTTNHDVKAIEYFIKQKLKNSKFKKELEFIHFALTSEDINNLSYSLMLKDGITNTFVPAISELMKVLKSLAKKYKKVSMLARTHGQPATPTTLGKEFAIYYARLKKQLDTLKTIRICGKLNGASGNFNAHTIAFPKIDWIRFSEIFVKSLGLEANLITYQIEPHDRIAEIFHSLTRINNIIINFDQDVWTYISQEYIGQKAIQGEIGSSAMPHKVNPIDFENSEGNLGLANAIFEHLARKLPISRLQRDLSDSTVIRNQGTALGYTVLGIKSTLKGLSKIQPNTQKIEDDLQSHVEVIAEAIQTVLRRDKQEMPYEKLMELTRGKKVRIEDFYTFIDNLKISEKKKSELKKITPLNYIGKAKDLVELALK